MSESILIGRLHDCLILNRAIDNPVGLILRRVEKFEESEGKMIHPAYIPTQFVDVPKGSRFVVFSNGVLAFGGSLEGALKQFVIDHQAALKKQIGKLEPELRETREALSEVERVLRGMANGGDQ